MQFKRPFTQNDLAINYPDEELAHAVKSTLTTIGILALPFLASIKRPEDVAKATAIERIGKLPSVRLKHVLRLRDLLGRCLCVQDRHGFLPIISL